MTSINTNTAATMAVRLLQAADRRVETMNRTLSTGLRVSGARDDASTFAIAQGLRGDIAAWDAVRQALAGGVGAVKVALAAGEAISNRIGDLKAKVIEYAAMTDPARKAMVAAAFERIVADIDTYAYGATYNGINLLTSGKAPTAPPQPSGFGITKMSGGLGPDIETYAAGPTPGTISVLFDAQGAADMAEILYDGVVVATTGGFVSGIHVLTFNYPAGAVQDFQVRITGSTTGTVWSYTTYFDYIPPPLPTVGTFPGLTVLHSIDGGTTTVDPRNMTSEGLGLQGLSLEPPEAALAAIDRALVYAGNDLAYFGRQHETIKALADGAALTQDALRAGLGASVDADMAAVSAEAQAAQVRRELAAQALGIASGAPRQLLRLFERVV